MEKRHFASFDSHETDPKEPTCSELATADMAAENCVFYQKECQACRYDFGTGNQLNLCLDRVSGAKEL